MGYKSKFRNVYYLIFFAVMFFMYFMRYYTQRTAYDNPEYASFAKLMMIIMVMLLLVMFAWLLKKANERNRLSLVLAMACMGGINFPTFAQAKYLGTPYMYVALLYMIMIWCLFAKKAYFFALLSFSLGVFIYPGFLFLGLPTLVVGLLEEKRRIKWLLLLALVVGTGIFILKWMGYLDYMDSYGVLEKVSNYYEFRGLAHKKKIRLMEAVVNFILYSPYVVLWRKYLKQEKKSIFPRLIILAPFAVEMILQRHFGWAMYFVVSFAVFYFIYSLLNKNEFSSSVLKFYASIKDYPGIYMVYVYPFLLTPFFIDETCQATQRIVSHVAILLSVN